MWIFTTGGFVSAVEHRDDPSLVMVRARDKKSLVNMLGSLNVGVEDSDKLHNEDEVFISPGSDYRWRTVVSKDEFTRFLTTEVRDYLDYDNFKSALTKTRGKVFHDVAMKVWSAMFGVSDYGENPRTPEELAYDNRSTKRRRHQGSFGYTPPEDYQAMVDDMFGGRKDDPEPEQENCEQCGNPDATYAPDPYAEEILDDETPVWLCEQCRADNALEI